MSREKEKEEKIFRAIGDLPEDMIADAANYRLPEKKTGYFEKLVLVGRGFACAACAALIIFGLVPWIYDIYRGDSRTKTESIAIEEQKSGASAGTEYGTDKSVDFDTSGTGEKKEGRLYLWSGVAGEISNVEKYQVEDSAGKKTAMSGEKEKSVAKEIKEGKTVRLYVMDLSVEGISETSKKVLSFKIGKEGDGITYTIRSATKNCNIASVTSGGETKQVDEVSVDCIGGDSITLNTFERAEASWVENPAPEWDGRDINILDVISITGEKEGEIYDFGKIVIGKKGEDYYGLQKKND